MRSCHSNQLELAMRKSKRNLQSIVMKSQLLGIVTCIAASTAHAIGESSVVEENSIPRRNLVDTIHNYIPRSKVSDAAALDLDLVAIQKELENQNDEGWANALSIYRHGAFSKPTATLNLTIPLNQSIASGKTITGMGVNGSQIVATTLGKASANDTSLRIAYDNDDITKEDHLHCSVGGNPTPILGGCLQAEGNITIDNTTFGYTYNITESNTNDRALVDLSSHAQSRMWTCSHCPFDTYSKFYQYYGEFDYADRIIQAAFYGQEMALDRGNMDFGYYTKYGMKEFISKAISYLSIWMYTIRQMEQAVADCDKGEFLQAVHFWDEAVVLYTGLQDGDSMWHLADLRCQEFSTCGEHGKDRVGQSHVNIQVLEHLEQGQTNLLHNRCERAREYKDEIVRLMTIPLIQATLRYAHILAHETYWNEKHSAQAAVYTLSILPLIHDCSPQDATTLYHQLKSKNTAEVDYRTVRAALENTYQCLNIQCSEVGGIWDPSMNDYKYDAFPCGGAEQRSSFLSAMIGGIIGGMIFLAILGYWTWRQRQKMMIQQKPEENNWLDASTVDEEKVSVDGEPPRVISNYSDHPEATKKKKRTKTSKRLRDMLKQMG